MVRSAMPGSVAGRDVLGAVVQEVLVDFVGDDEEIVLDGEIGDDFKLGAGEDFAAGIGWGVDDDAAGTRGDGGAEVVEVDGPCRSSHRHGDGVDAQGAERVEVVSVERLEEDDLVAGIEEGHRGGIEGSGGTGGDEDFGIGVGGEVVVAGKFGGRWRCAAGRCRRGGCRCCSPPRWRRGRGP